MDEIRAILTEQLRLLHEASRNNPNKLYDLTDAMVKIANCDAFYQEEKGGDDRGDKKTDH